MIRRGGGERAEEATSQEADATRDAETDRDTCSWTPNPADDCWHPMIDAGTRKQGLQVDCFAKERWESCTAIRGLDRCSGKERHGGVEDGWRTGSLILAAKDAAARSDCGNVMAAGRFCVWTSDILPSGMRQPQWRPHFPLCLAENCMRMSDSATEARASQLLHGPGSQLGYVGILLHLGPDETQR